jgi:two-component system, NtrC family, response regulator AtoC
MENVAGKSSAAIERGREIPQSAENIASPRVLVVDDERLVRWAIAETLSARDCTVVEAGDAQSALHVVAEGVDLVLLDYKLPDADGLSILKKIKEADADTLVIMLTAHSSVDVAVEAMKAGAYHYANKPFNLDEIALLVEKALETTRLRREVRALRASQARPYSVDRIVGASKAIGEAKALLQKVAASPASTVLLTGESGTGKDLAAKVLHYASDRAARPFMNITCSALPEQILESELFGHERGAFTDARQQKRGLLESADGGTVFLDEIGEMAPGLQAKLLRFLEEKTFKRVGGIADIRVDVRVVAATNRQLEDEVKKGRFREDLYYRLNVLPIVLPPLRAHADDIPALVHYFIDAYNTEFRKRVRGITDDAMRRLQTYGWPGNIRELRNAVERAMLLVEGPELTADQFPVLSSVHRLSEGVELPPTGIDLEQLERSLVVQALERSVWNQTKAATLLGLNRDQIRYRIEKFKLERPTPS